MKELELQRFKVLWGHRICKDDDPMRMTWSMMEHAQVAWESRESMMMVGLEDKSPL